MSGGFPRTERPHHPHRGIEAGDFRRDGQYRNWRSRGTADWLLIYTISGGGRVGTAESEMLSGAGTLTLYEPGTPQYYYTDPGAGRWHLLWAHFHPRPHWEPWLHWGGFARGLRSVEIADPALRRQVRKDFSASVRVAGAGGSHAADLALNALERVILLVQDAAGGSARDVRIRRAAEVLLTRLRDPFSLPELARAAGLSVSRLCQLFSRETGLSPRRYLESLRLRRACHFLRSTRKSIAEIASESGFSDPFYFSQRFRRTFGLSPSEFRRRPEQSASPE